MADVDDFFRLKEYDSLGREAQGLAEKMEEGLRRLKRLEDELLARRTQLTERTAARGQLKHQIAELERRLAQRLSPEVMDQLENQGLELLSALGELESLIADDNTFITGFTQTIQSIQQEVTEENQRLTQARSNLLERAQLLRPQLPDGWAETHAKIAQKKPAHGVFTRLTGLTCQFCRYSVSKVFESEVDTQFQLKSCASCGRLFLPYKAVAG